MDLHYATSQGWSKDRRKLLTFAIRFGEKRITAAALHALRRLEPSWLETGEDGKARAAVVSVTAGGVLAGIGFAVDGGEGGCLLVVHPEARRLGAGKMIMQALITRLGHLSCHVAADNIPSLALCFGLGMKAVSIHKGPTGKSTLRFERGLRHDSACSGHSDALP